MGEWKGAYGMGSFVAWSSARANCPVAHKSHIPHPILIRFHTPPPALTWKFDILGRPCCSVPLLCHYVPERRHRCDSDKGLKCPKRIEQQMTFK